MHVFISYGHDANTALVDRVEKDLRAANHTTWRDTGPSGPDVGIREGDVWRERIVNGLRTTDWVLAFLSQHAMRPGGVCREEIAIALSMRGGGVTTVLVEPKAQVKPPSSVSALQMVDMHDWAARAAEDPAAFEAWYVERLNTILGILADPANQRFAAELRELETLLTPEPQGADIPPLTRGFVGRAWLLERLRAWLAERERTHLVWLAAAPGQGKSAFAAWLADTERAQVIAINLCRFGRDRRNDPRVVVRTLAYQIATRLPEYRGALLAFARQNDPNGQAMMAREPADLFHALILQRLHAIDGGRHQEPLLIVVDGLDETVTQRDGVRSCELGELLEQEAKALPGWMALLVTGRPDSPLAPVFRDHRRLTLDAEEAANTKDLRDYVRGWLPDADAAQVERIVAAAAGNFGYVTALRRAVTAGKLLLEEAHLPRGLFGLYRLWFERQFPTEAAYAPVRDVFAVLVAASRPVPEAMLVGLFAWGTRAKLAMRATLGSLVRWEADGIAAFHLTLRDWLTDESAEDGPGERFIVEVGGPDGGRERLRRHLWERFAAAAAEPDAPLPDAFAMAELTALLASRPARDLARDTAALADPVPVLSRSRRTAEAAQGRFAWALALAWWDLLARLAEASGPKGADWRIRPLLFRGDIQVTLGNTGAALAAYRDARDAGEARVAADPGNAQWQRDLSVSHSKLGDVAVAQGDLDAARAAYRADLAIAERLAASDPGNAQWQRDLSVSHDRLGDVAVAQGDLDAARGAFRAGLAIRERLAASDPGNAEWQRDLSVSHSKLGDVAVAQGDLDAARSAFRASHAIAERLAASDPGNAQWQRDLSFSHSKLGDVAVAQGDLDAARSAFRASHAIAERLAASDPGNAEWQRDLSVSHSKLGDVAVAQGDLDAARGAFRASHAIAERLAASDPGNAQWQRDLSVSHSKLGDVAVAQGDLDAARAAYRAGLAIAERLAASDPGNAEWQRDLSVSHNKLGNVAVAQGDLDAARGAFRARHAIAERLAASDPGNAEWQRDLSVSHSKLGDVAMAQGDLDAARSAYRAGHAIAERLAASDPGNARWQRDLSISHDRLGDVAVAQGDLDAARAAYRAGLAIRERLAASDPGNAEWQRDVIVSCDQIAEVSPAEAAAMLTRALAIARALRDAGRLRPVDAWIPDDFERRLAAAGGAA